MKKDNDGNLIKTSSEYAVIVTKPSTLLPFETKDVIIKVDVPQNYNEIIKVDNKIRKVPFHITLKASGLECIEEI